MENGEDSKLLLGFFKSCGHHFHIVCIQNWLKVASVCPICRASSNTKGLIQISFLQLNRAILKSNENGEQLSVISENDKQSHNSITYHPCGICKNSFHGDARQLIVAYVTSCGHYFHTNCVYAGTDDVCLLQMCPSCDTSNNYADQTINAKIEVSHALLADIPCRTSH